MGFFAGLLIEVLLPPVLFVDSIVQSLRLLDAARPLLFLDKERLSSRSHR